AISQRDRIVFGSRAQHSLAIDSLASVVRRRRNVDEQMSIADQRLQLRGASGIPDVFADVHSNSSFARRKHRTTSAALKIALFIKHSVVRQKVLVIGVDKFSAGDDRGRVVDIRTVRVYKANDDDKVLRRLDDSVEGFDVFTHEVRFE